MSYKIFTLRKNNKPKGSTTSGKSASGKSRNLKTLTDKIYKPIGKSKLWFLLIVLLIASTLSAQDVLVSSANAPKVKAALELIKKYEPDIYESVIKKSKIQLGELSQKDKGTCWCIDEAQAGKKILWIMLSPNIVDNESINWIASTILHEAMHLRFGLSLATDIENDSYAKREKTEHTTIFNYEIFFLRRVGASKKDISNQINLMRQLSISII
ncbi:MAG: hypothetical protein NT153_05250 [Bacteroidetes bacterium]|nr:hypothetical protein [Bacteroidota bacterium]